MDNKKNIENEYLTDFNKYKVKVEKKIMKNIGKAFNELDNSSKKKSEIYNFTIYLRKWGYRGPTWKTYAKQQAIDNVIEELNKSGDYKYKIVAEHHNWDKYDMISLLFRLPYDKHTVLFIRDS